MKHLFLLLALGCSFSLAFGQTPTQISTPQTSAMVRNLSSDKIDSTENLRLRTLNNILLGEKSLEEQRNIIRQQLEYFYRKPKDSELKNLLIDSKLSEKYKLFLGQNNTGLIRLVPDIGCESENKTLTVNDDCLKYQIPGNGSAYSFRAKTYRTGSLADLVFKDDSFFSNGKFIQSVIANLGDKDIELLTLTSEGVKELAAFEPEESIKLVASQVEKLKKEILVNNVLFSNKAVAEKNSTYILRSIAYDTKHFVLAKKYTYNNFDFYAKDFTYDEFDFDKRLDIIVAFRVVDKNDDGSVVLLWKELRNKKSPKLVLK